MDFHSLPTTIDELVKEVGEDKMESFINSVLMFPRPTKLFRPLVWKFEGRVTLEVINRYTVLENAWRRRGKNVVIYWTLTTKGNDTLTLTVG